VFSLNEVKIEIHKSYGRFLNNKKLAARDIKKMDQALIKKRAEFTSWRHHLTPLQQKIVDFIQVVMRVRDERKNHFAKGITVAWRIAEKLFKEAKVNRQLIENVLPFTELMKGSKYIKKIKKELQRREKGYVVYVPYDGKIEVSYNNLESEHNLLNESLRKGNNNKTNEIIGQIGHRGFARGRVRIIKSAENFNSFKRGEILVSGMTRPEYVPLMHKAKAIITDEGGITCHAAIVSRELNKPCIIGTRFATQILKDGDLVVVDAEKGIVKIIKKSSI
jgi:phosphoenolpyruvate synthase/pyruvate phosphate dikinase